MKKKLNDVPQVKCLLGRLPGEYFACKAGCGRCGWNQDVLEQRNRLWAAQGLTMGPDGIERLILPGPPAPEQENME